MPSHRLVQALAIGMLLLAAGLAEAIPTIVVPGGPSLTQSEAADELGRCLYEITGQRVRLWPDLPAWGELEGWQKQEDVFFIVGDTRFSHELRQRCADRDPEAYCLHSDGNVLYLVGASERATLYAVYQYLSSLGCRWLTPGREGEVIPKLDKLPAFDFDEFHSPANRRRDLADFNDVEPYIVQWLVRNRLNSAAAQSQLDASWGPMIAHYWDCRGGPALVRYHGHSYSALVPAGLFEQHPDWFALIDGKRTPTAIDAYWGAEFKTQLCTSNPEAVAHIAAQVDQWFTAHPEYGTFGLVPNDGGGWCECEGCRAQDRPPAGHAGRVIALANAVAEAIAPKHPDKELLVLAYADRYLEPPEGLAIHPNVRVQVCVWPNFLQPITGPQPEEGQYYYHQLQGWADRKCRLAMWLYPLYAAQTPFDLSIRAMALDARTYRDLGSAEVLHECGGARCWQNVPMATWCWMQLAWDPDLDWKWLIGDFCSHYYGAAGEAVGQVFLSIEDRLEATGALYEDEVFTEAFVTQVKQGLARAAELADTDLARERVAALAAMVPAPQSAPQSLPAGRWYHVAATWEAREGRRTARVYADGQLVGEAEGELRAWEVADTLYIGRLRRGGGAFDGQMDELRISATARQAFALEQASAVDDATTLLARFDTPGSLDADFARGPDGDPKALPRLPAPYSPARSTPDGRFGAGLDIRQDSSCCRFDAVVYRSAGLLSPDAGTIELWLRPSAHARYMADGTLLDAGGLQLTIKNSVLKLEVGGVAAEGQMQ